MNLFYLQKFLHVLHLVGMVAWFAGLFYLVRLYVYHEECEETLKATKEKKQTPLTAENAMARITGYRIMERRLLRAITTPAMILTLLAGLTSAWLGGFFSQGWIHAKLALVFLLMGYHHHLGAVFKKLQTGTSGHTPRFYRMYNEIATVLLVSIVSLAVFRSLLPAIASSAIAVLVFLLIYLVVLTSRKLK